MPSFEELLLLAPHFAFSISCHECAHAWVADRLGDPAPRALGRITLNPFKHLDLIGTLLLVFAGVGFAKPVAVNPGRFRDPVRDMMRVALAGPLTNLALAVVFAALYRNLAVLPFSSLRVGQFLYIGVWINVALAVFNLLPVPPLDGSRVLRAFVGPRARSVMNQVEPYGFLIVIALAYADILPTLVFTPARLVMALLLGA